MPADLRSKQRADAERRPFDGVVCFGGGDWWYHNHGHYDFQMMKQLRQRLPVLYVNSIGIRVPKLSEGRMFAHRIVRKLASLRRGFSRIEDRFAVMSPIVVPGRMGMSASKWALPAQVRMGARRMGIRRPLLWITCPPAIEAADALDPGAIVYQRTDRWEAFPEADEDHILGCHHRLQKRADLALYCSSLLYEEEAAACRDAAFIDHGVDFDRFAEAGKHPEPEPEDLRNIPRPRVGFIGALDALTFDPELFVKVVRQLPDVQFVLVGGSTLPAGWIDAPNVALLGQKPYEEVPRYMAACDVLLMPWNDSEWIRACNPIKLKEYLAVGRPIVSTPFHELQRYEGFVRVAEGAEAFVRELREALAHPPDPARQRARVEQETWVAKCQKVLDRLAEKGIVPEGTRR